MEQAGVKVVETDFTTLKDNSERNILEEIQAVKK
jgi:hypothetical protein